MIDPRQRKPPEGAPEGTVWSGGPVDRFCVSLWISGESLDPDRISELLGCEPSRSERKGIPLGARIPKRGQWHLTIESKNCGPEVEIEDAVKLLLDRLPSDRALWASLTRDYKVDLFCGIFMDRGNQGFGLRPETLRMLAERGLEIGFDIYRPDSDEDLSPR